MAVASVSLSRSSFQPITPRDSFSTACELIARDRQIMEERGDIGIAGVDLVPEGLPLPRFEVAGDKCRLARSGRAGDPDGGPMQAIVEQREQALARDCAEHPRSRQLR